MFRHRLWLFLCLAVASTGFCACSVAVDSARVQCTTNSDCTDRGPEFAGRICSESVCVPDPTWSCLDEPASAQPTSGTVHVIMTAVDLLSQKPLAGVGVTVCAKLDANCDFPLAQYQSSDGGQLDIVMTAGFDGYLQTQGGGVYPTLFFPPNTRKQRAPSALPMVPASFFDTMFAQIGASVSGDRSVIMTTALDCLGRPAAGMVLASPQTDENSVSYVLQAGLPSRTALTTDEAGAGGFVNIKAGTAVITATIAATNRLAGTVAVQTRPGHLSMVLVVPTGG